MLFRGHREKKLPLEQLQALAALQFHNAVLTFCIGPPSYLRPCIKSATGAGFRTAGSGYESDELTGYSPGSRCIAWSDPVAESTAG